MTLQQALEFLKDNGYIITASKGGGFRVLAPDGELASDAATAADIIAVADNLQAAAIPWWNPAWGSIPRNKEGGVDWTIALKIAEAKGAFGESLFYTTSYTEAQREAAKRTNATAPQAARGAGTPAFTWEVVPSGGGYTVQVKVAQPPSGAMSQADAEAEAKRLGDKYEAWRDPNTGQWYVQLKGQVAPSGAMSEEAAKAEAARLGPKYEAFRNPNTGQWYVDLAAEVEPAGQIFNTYEEALKAAPTGFQPVQRTDGKWVFERVEAEKPGERFLGTVEDGGWQIDQYGIPDPAGEYTDPKTGQRYRITARQPRQPIKDPVLSLDELISQALVDVDFSDPNWATDTGYLRAQSLRNFKNQPTSQERLQMALQIAQSPSDYLTLVALYTGAIQRETPAKVGERIAPLAPILQMMAQQFFLDIPGINHVPTQEEITPPFQPPIEPPGEGDGEIVPPFQPPIEPPGEGEIVPPGGAPPGWIVASNGRFYDPTNYVWEDWDEFVARTGYKEPEPTIVPPTGEEVEVRDELGLFGGAPVTSGLQTFGPQTMQTVSQGALAQQAGQQPKMLSIQEQVQQAQGQTLSPKVAKAVGTETVGGLDTSLSMLGSVGKLLEDLAKTAQGNKQQRVVRRNIPEFQAGGVVPGYLGQPQMAQVEGGEVVLTPEQIQALLQQSGMLGSVYRPDLQQLPQFLAQPRRVSLAELTGGALRPRSLQTIRRQSPTQRMLTVEMAKSFGVPAEDFLEEEAMATSIGGPRRMARFSPGMMRTRR